MTRTRPPSRDRARGGFSLVEILVAVSVLALLLVLLLQVVNGTLMSSKTANQQMDATGAARRALDVFQADLQNAVVGPGATLLAGTGATDRVAMIVRGRGPKGVAPSRFLAVKYRLTDASGADPNALQRVYSAVDWDDDDLLAASVATASAAQTSSLASGVLALSIQAILENGDRREIRDAVGSSQAWAIAAGGDYRGVKVPANFQALVPASPPTPNPLDASTARVTALEITLVAMDDQNYRLLEKTGKLAGFAGRFTTPTGGQSPASRWSDEIQNASNVPAAVRSATRVLTKTVLLP